MKDFSRKISSSTLVSAFVLVLALFTWPGNAFAHAPKRTSAHPMLFQQESEGVVVESVSPQYAAAAGSLREGDVIVSWRRGEREGKVESPFALIFVENTDVRSGGLELSGFHDGVPRTWVLGAGKWRLQVHPHFAPDVLLSYEAALESANAGKFESATAGLTSLARASSDPSRAWLYYRLGKLMAAKRQWSEAAAAFERARAEGTGNAVIQWSVLSAQADAFTQQGNFEQTKSFQSLAAAVEGGPGDAELLRASSLVQLTIADWQLGNLAQAKQHIQRSLEIVQRLAPISFTAALAWDWLGSIAKDEGNIDEAEAHYQRAMAVWKKLECDNVTEAGITDNLLATVEYMRGDFIHAERDYERAIQIEERYDPTDPNLTIALVGVMAVAAEQKEAAKATRYIQRILSSMTDTADTSNKGLIYLQIGDAYLKQDDISGAENYFRRSLSVFEKIKSQPIGIVAALYSMGDIAFAKGNLKEADEYFQRSLKIGAETDGNSISRAQAFMGLGQISLARNQSSQALLYYQNAIPILEKTSPNSEFVARGYFGIAEANARMGLNAPALQFYERAVNAIESQSAKIGGSADAVASFRADHANYYRKYVDLLVSQKNIEQAFQVSERLRARSLLQMLSSAHVDIHTGANPQLIRQEASLGTDIKAKMDIRVEILGDASSTDRLKAIEQEISTLLSDYRDLEGRIRDSSPAYAALTQPQPLTAKAIQRQLLDQETLLLEYSLGEERSHVFAVTPDSLQAIELPKRTDIEKQARLVYQLLTEPNRQVRGESAAQRDRRWAESARAYDVAAAELTRMILQPLAPLLKNKRLVIVADGALHYVPFAALPEPVVASGHTNGERPASESATESPATPPLTINHEIVSLPSASVLALLRQQYKDRKPAPNAVAVLADPVFNQRDPRVSRKPAPPSAPSLSESLLTRSAGDLGLSRNGQLALPRLRYSREEADAIYAVTPKSKALEATDFKANRATAISPDLANYRIIHFATHGLLNSQHPELSGLVFSLVDKNGKPQDGFLTLQDIYNLNLPADLVVLSACETGLGKEISGEGLIGLTRGFIYAGASRVVASLWNVSDVATAHLMAEFYRAMEKDGLPPAAALRAAQVKMLQQKRWASPYYWAAFQLQGEWK